VKPASDQEAAERTTCELAQSLQRGFRDRDQLYRDIDATVFSEIPVEIPEAYQDVAVEVRAPLALHIAQTITAALSVNRPAVVFRPVGFGDVYQQNATLREHFFEASWTRQEREARRQLTRLFMWSMAIKGEGVLKTVERSSVAWRDYGKSADEYLKQLEADGEFDQHAQDQLYDKHTEGLKLALPYPIATTDVPPETFYYEKNENGYTAVVEIKDLPYNEALERFGAGLDSSGKVVSPEDYGGYDPRAASLARAEWQRMMSANGQTTIRCIEAWDSAVQVCLLQGPGQLSKGMSSSGAATLCRVRHHAYGDPILKTLRGPYFHALGITTASRLPEHAGLSVLFGYLPLFKLLNSLLTVQGNAAYLTGYPAYKETQPPNAIPGLPPAPFGNDGREKATPAQKIEPGKLYPFDIAPVDQPRSGADLEKLLGNIQQLIELALPSVVQGMVAGDQSGYALNQAAYLARLSWDPIVDNAEVALAERTDFESWLIQNRISEKVYAWGEQEGKPGQKRNGGGQTKGTWLAVGPDDLKGVHRYEVKLKPQTPSNEIIEIRALGEKMQLKLISYEDAVEKAGSNPDEVEKSWLLHDLKQSPEIQQELKNAVFQKVATIRATRLQAAGGPSIEEMAGGPPGGGPPAGPPTAVPGTPGTPPSGNLGGMPGNPVPSPGMGLPIAPPPPGPVPGLPPGGIPGNPVVPGPPSNAMPLPGR
jgi:hypothetical protein